MQTIQPAGAIRLRDVLPNSRIVGGTEIRATSCCGDSRLCRPGDVFVALTGARHDGHDFVDDAIRAGAKAIVSERLLPVRIPVCIVDDTREAYGQICQSLVSHPSESMRVVGVTGTHGKTTTSVLIQSILRAADNFAGHMTSLENSDGLEKRAASGATPEAPEMARWLARMWANGCTHAVTEISSKALAQRKVAGVSLDAAVITNIRCEHLDLHLNVENYRRAKRRLLDHLKPEGFVVINADDPTSEKLLDEIDHPVLTIGMHNPAELSASIIERHQSEQTFLLHVGNESVAVRTRLIGDHYVYNCLAAAAVGLVMGIDVPTVVRGIESVDRIPGRMERIDCGQSFGVFVDKANAPGSLSACLKALRRVTPGRVICVYGPDGRRPRELRPQLGSVVEKGADIGIITTNNPRHDEPLQIAHDVLDGYNRPGSAQVMPGRQRAIEWALTKARRGDAVLIAGKGADGFQLVGSKKKKFDDCEVARAWLYSGGGKKTKDFSVARPQLRIAPHTI
jgi:UDP-N-acetylmuramoyl-L-alanyl-D-glutamate--2,6-diaminopimelate ligase